MKPYEVIEGDSPLILGQPHGGLWLPSEVEAQLNDRGRGLDDADWHIAKLHEDLAPGASVVRSHVHRYVVDANRDPSGVSLYPGQNTTALVPMTDFNGRSIWTTKPSEAEVEARRLAYHAPYHVALSAEIARVKAIHGVAILYDCHSIRSNIPFLFDGVLPVFNIGDNNGATCDPRLTRLVAEKCETSAFSAVTNGRFKGGWTTRNYGDPANGVHAIQMEMAQRVYMNEAPIWDYRTDLADQVRPVLSDIFQSIVQFADELKRAP